MNAPMPNYTEDIDNEYIIIEKRMIDVLEDVTTDEDERIMMEAIISGIERIAADTIRDNKNEDQVQFYHSIQYTGEPFNLITMLGQTLFSVSDWTLNDLDPMSILHTNKGIERCAFRLPLQRSDYATGEINLPIMLSRWTINDLADLNILFPLYGNDEGTIRVLGKQYTSYNTAI